MKRYLMLILIFILCYTAYDYTVYYNGDLYYPHQGEVVTFSQAQDKRLWIDEGDGFEVFDLRGVNLGLGKPGKFATEYSISTEEYLRWFKQIQDMGANAIRTYTLAHEDFYEAFYQYNQNNEDPLYLIHGVWVDDYMLNSHRNAFHEDFYQQFMNASKDVVDVIHGKHKSSGFHQIGRQHYDRDISQWVYGYIIGVEWENTIVAYTNETVPQLPEYEGQYLYTEGAQNFEIFLAMIGDEMIDYETTKYGTQRTLAFSNWPTTDPFTYSEEIALHLEKFASVDVNHIKATDRFLSGQYASYHVYPYFPEFMGFLEPDTQNTYLEYLTKLTDHHDIPVVISEFGVPSSRGKAAYEENRSLGRDQGGLNEQEQGIALVSMYEDIKNAGCAGAIAFTWQDEWFKRTWNTMAYTDLNHTAYWSDYQTNEQYFGLLAFDPGASQSISYVDGNKSEWTSEDVVAEQNDYQLSMKYDSKFLYFLVEKENFDLSVDTLYLPIDTTPKTGATIITSPYKVNVSKPADFVIVIDGEEDSRILVQERYDFVDLTYVSETGPLAYHRPPAKDSSVFHPIRLPLNEEIFLNGKEPIVFSQYNLANQNHKAKIQTYETGRLTYGNANPSSDDFNSLADFYAGNGFVEIKVPWQLLNFADPTNMNIHDDYYEHYGVEYISINKLHIGVGDGIDEITMEEFPLKKLDRNPEYHERLKESYYILKDYWTMEES